MSRSFFLTLHRVLRCHFLLIKKRGENEGEKNSVWFFTFASLYKSKEKKKKRSEFLDYSPANIKKKKNTEEYLVSNSNKHKSQHSTDTYR